MSEAAAYTHEAREHDSAGFFIGGPRFVTPSDVLARMMAEQHCPISASTPENERKRTVTLKGRKANGRRAHGPSEFYAQLRPAA